MPRVTMHVFDVKGKMFRHSIDYGTDATHITDENGDDLFSVNSSGYVTRGDNPKYIAKFKLFDSKYWMYDSTNFSDTPRIIKWENADLTKVELFVFKTLLEEELTTSTEQTQ